MNFDANAAWPVSSRMELGHGAISSFIDEVVQTPSGGQMHRQYLTHPGAVAVVAWDEGRDEIAVLRQYRHPVRMELVEIPAGLLDVVGEDYWTAAQRELAEEAELAAGRWNVLVDIFTTPGACEESLRIFLARGLSAASRPQGFILRDEEAEMRRTFLPREVLVQAILSGRCESPTLVSGVLALEVARLSGSLDSLRPVDAPWPARSARGL